VLHHRGGRCLRRLAVLTGKQNCGECAAIHTLSIVGNDMASPTKATFNDIALDTLH
jgi:hypothetical protein